MAVSIEHSCSQQLNCRGIRLLRRVLVPCAWPSVRSTECLRASPYERNHQGLANQLLRPVCSAIIRAESP
jgi:hypothetical protein